ncbi:MAG: S-methyl-5-thioribose-1-phosphate isomerase [Betaproteobacteria bacterium]
MNVDPSPYRALTHAPGTRWIGVIDQRALPHERVDVRIADVETAALAIRDMWIRGAPLIGAVGAYGLAMALDHDPRDAALDRAFALLDAARPTAVNLRWALSRVRTRVAALPDTARAAAAWDEAERIAAEDIDINHAIGRHGLPLLRAIALRKAGTVNVLTHCNAGALATCGFGTATAPLFLAHAEGIALNVLVSETRPRLQGANLTAWEMREQGIAHALVADGAAAMLMRRGDVDVVLVGADRVTRNGDVCNKIGTYAKALAAQDNGVPFYVALPSPTLDVALASGDEVPIEVRDEREMLEITGRDASGASMRVTIAPPGTPALNFAFDITPARLVTGFITERGVVGASEGALRQAFADRF